jgi:uncharacterized protein (DUF924 family)
MEQVTDEDQMAIRRVLEFWFGGEGARDDPDSILDCMRNLWFAEDPGVDEEIRARFVLEGLALGVDKQLAPVERLFLYLPLEHSESLADQERSVERFEALHREAPPEAQAYTGIALDYARRHKAVIERFGRFPHRNEALGHPSTAAEEAFLREHGAGF